MAQTQETIDRIIGRLYTNFILRDLTFFVSGAIVLVVAVPKPLKLLSQKLPIDRGLYWVAVLAFLAISYVLGVLLQEVARFPLDKASKWYNEKKFSDIQTKPRKKIVLDDLKGELVVKLEKIYRLSTQPNERTINGLERILFLKQIAATQFSALGAVIIVLKVHFYFDHHFVRHPVIFLLDGLTLWGKTALLVLGMALCFWMYLDKARQQEWIILGLLDLEETD